MASKLIEKQVLYSGKKIRLEIHHLDDEQGQRYQKEVVVHPGAVVILPFLDDDTILLINNYRYTIGQFLIELPAGTLEKGEAPMNAAGRELLEETGYIASKLKALFNMYPSPGVLSEKMYIFTARDLKKSSQKLELGEQIELMPTKLEDAMAMVKNGDIQDAKTLATLTTYYHYHRGK